MTNGVRLSVLPTRNGVHHITLCSLLKKPVSMHTAITAELWGHAAIKAIKPKCVLLVICFLQQGSMAKIPQLSKQSHQPGPRVFKLMALWDIST